MAVRYVQENGKIANGEYQRLQSTSRATATRDLTDLVAKKVFKLVEKGKRATFYVLKSSNEQNEANEAKKLSNIPNKGLING